MFFQSMLKQLYTRESLRSTDDGFSFQLKNRLLAAKLVGVRRVSVDGRDVSLDGAQLVTGDGRIVTPEEVSAAAPLEFELGETFEVRIRGERLGEGEHQMVIEFDAVPFGGLRLEVEDVMRAGG